MQDRFGDRIPQGEGLEGRQSCSDITDRITHGCHRIILQPDHLLHMRQLMAEDEPAAFDGPEDV